MFFESIFFAKFEQANFDAPIAAMENTVDTLKATKQSSTTVQNNPSVACKRSVDSSPHQGEKVDEKLSLF